MGPVLAILSNIIKVYRKLISLMQKDTNPSYNADTDSNEAISEAVYNLQTNANSACTLATSIKNNTYSLTRHEHNRTLSSQDSIVFEKSNIAEPFIFQGGMISLSNIQYGDVVTIKLMVKMYSVGAYTTIDQFTIGQLPVSNNMIEFSPMYNQYGVKVTVAQSAGAYRQIKSEWFDSVQLG